MVRPSKLGDLGMFMCRSKRRRRWSRIAWNGPRSGPLSSAVAREIGGLGEQQGRKERPMRQPLCAVTAIGQAQRQGAPHPQSLKGLQHWSRLAEVH